MAPLKNVCFSFLDVQSKCIVGIFSFYKLCQKQSKIFSKTFQQEIKFSWKIISTLFWLNEFIKCTEPVEDNLRFFGIRQLNTLVLLDIDYLWCLHFSYCTGQDNGANGRIGRENLHGLQTIEIGQFSGGTKIGFWLFRVFLLLCSWSEVYHIYYRLIEKHMKYQATNSCGKNSIGYQNETRESWKGISRSVCEILKSISELNFILSPIWS